MHFYICSLCFRWRGRRPQSVRLGPRPRAAGRQGARRPSQRGRERRVREEQRTPQCPVGTRHPEEGLQVVGRWRQRGRVLQVRGRGHGRRPLQRQGLNSIHFRVLTKMFTKILMKIVTKKLSKSYTKNFMKLEVGTCLLFKFGFVKIFVKIFVRILKCIELGPCPLP